MAKIKDVYNVRINEMDDGTIQIGFAMKLGKVLAKGGRNWNSNVRNIRKIENFIKEDILRDCT